MFSLHRVVLIVLTLGLVGCAGVVRDLGKAGGQGVTSGVVGELKTPENQRGLAAVASSPGQEASQAVGVGLGRGLADEVVALGTGRTPLTIAGGRAAALDPNGTTRPAGSLTDGMSADRVSSYMRDNVDPAVAELIRQSVEKGMREALSPQARADAHAMAESVGDGATRGILGQLHTDIRATLNDPQAARVSGFINEKVDPAVAEMVRRAVEQGMREALSPQSRADAGEMAQAVGDNAVHGVLTALQRDGGPMLNHITADQIGPAVGVIFSQQIRPALKDFFDRDIAPTVIRILQESAANALKVPVRPDVASAVVINSSNLSKGATFGTHDAMIDLGMLNKEGSITAGTRLFMYGVVAVVVLAGLVAVGFLIVLTMIAFKLRRGAASV